MKLALPLSIPFVFAGVWFASYKLSGNPVPEGAARYFWIWLLVTVIVVPPSLGYVVLVAIGGHASGSDVYPILALAAIVWLSIIPVLLYKTAIAGSSRRRDSS